MARIDVVVVCWNDKEKIATALDSVFPLSEVRADPGFAQVVVSDNGSEDGSREYIASAYDGRVRSSKTVRTSASPRPATARSRRRPRNTSTCSTPTRN